MGETFSERLSKLPWENKGGYFEVAVVNWDDLNKARTRFSCKVYIRERKPRGALVTRVGDGRKISNTTKIWVNWKGRSINLENLLMMGA